MIDFDIDRVGKSPFVIGLLGSVVSLRGAPGASWPERLFNVFCGSMLAGFVSPAVAEYFGLNSTAMQAGSAFLVGLFGLNLVATIVQWLKTITLADLLPWRKER